MNAALEFIDDLDNLQERSKSNPSSLYPTGRCFDDAMEYMSLVFKESGKKALAQLTMVHGVIHIEGRAIVHGWIEDDKNVIEGKFLRGERVYAFLDLKEYYTELMVKDFVKYTAKQALMLNLQSGNFGPWLPRYRKMLRNEK